MPARHAGAFSEMQRFLRYGFHLGLAFLVTAGIAVALQPTDAIWWTVRVPGLAALLLAAAALACPPFPLKPAWHRWLGWLAAGGLGLHIVLAIGLEPELWQWLSSAIPVEIVFGLAGATALCLTLALRRSRTLRLRLGPFAALGLHRIAGIVGCTAGAAHVVLAAGAGIGPSLLLSGGIVAALASGLSREGHVLAVVLLMMAAIAAVLTLGPLSEMRLASLRTSPIDHAGFLHADHTKVTCVTCHHNFVDQTGKENCLPCHKRLGRSETMRVDRMFHAFCGECHRDDKRAGRATGPIDDCMGCHGPQPVAGKSVGQ
jgi:hypothetical protein